MSLLAKFIESIQVRLYDAGFREVVTPFLFDGRVDDQTILILNHSAQLRLGDNDKPVKPGSFLFIPKGQRAHFQLGRQKNKNHKVVNGFTSDEHRREYLKEITGLKPLEEKKEIVIVVSMSLFLYNTIPFFPLVGMPPISIPHSDEFQYLVHHLALEKEQKKLGRDVLLNNYMEEIMIHLFRYIESQPQLLPYIDQLNFLSDKRLAEIVNYIQQNLEKDLTNKAIAKVAGVSEDYVGQFFKGMTKRNLQDYVENQRLEKALLLFKTVPGSVLEVAAQVGFKDAAYFSRRFKNKYGVNATEVKRQRDYIV